jgi:hypothetical protein
MYKDCITNCNFDDSVVENCPVCGGECTHLDSKEEQYKWDGTPISYDEEDYGKRFVGGRNAELVIHFWCESGCKYMKVYSEHKGMIYTQTINKKVCYETVKDK